jgi:hypothetical protein
MGQGLGCPLFVFLFFFSLKQQESVVSYELERFNERFTTMYIAFKGSMMGAAQTDFVLAQIMREFSDGTVERKRALVLNLNHLFFLADLHYLPLFAKRKRSGAGKEEFCAV